MRWSWGSLANLLFDNRLERAGRIEESSTSSGWFCEIWFANLTYHNNNMSDITILSCLVNDCKEHIELDFFAWMSLLDSMWKPSHTSRTHKNRRWPYQGSMINFPLSFLPLLPYKPSPKQPKFRTRTLHRLSPQSKNHNTQPTTHGGKTRLQDGWDKQPVWEMSRVE
jgi:hypothetical protein